MGARMSQFMTKIMFTGCCLQYFSQLFDGFEYNKANSVIFETNRLIISLLLLVCKHVPVLQIA